MKSLTGSTRFAALVAVVLILVVALSACQSAPAGPDKDASAKPSNPGGPGAAIGLTGDAAKGATIFTANCVSCHGDKGVGGVANPGSTDGTVPALNPVDSTMVNADAKAFATNLDLFIEHGSTPSGSAPTLSMLPFGDNKTLTPQEIADVLAYVISLNK
jgi:mono/diheme cytochrome c family protein